MAYNNNQAPQPNNDFVRTRGTHKGKTLKGDQDTISMFFGAEDLRKLLAKIQENASEQDGVCLKVFMGKTKDGSKDSASILVQPATRNGSQNAAPAQPAKTFVAKPTGYSIKPKTLG